MADENEWLQDYHVDYFDSGSNQYIGPNLFQTLEFPKEYPVFIRVHREYPKQTMPLHWHPSSEVIYSRNQELDVVIDGKSYAVHPGEFILISSYALHTIIPKLDIHDQDVMSIGMQVSFLESMYPDLQKMVVSREAPNATDADIKKMEELCEDLLTEIEKEEKSNVHNFTVNQIIYDILNLMYSAFLVGQNTDLDKRQNAYGKMVDVLDYLHENFREHMTTQSVADRFGYSREYFCHIFKKYANQTFKQYLTDLRLSEAAEQVKLSDQSVGQIGISCGFPDTKSFFTAFKKKYGLTPVQYRNHYQK